jgi:hypothetical protein
MDEQKALHEVALEKKDSDLEEALVEERKVLEQAKKETIEIKENRD